MLTHAANYILMYCSPNTCIDMQVVYVYIPPTYSNFYAVIYIRWPNVLVQFEDFQNQRAVALLERYRRQRLCFNDDIQGTGAVAVGGVLCSLLAKNKTFQCLSKEKILIAGAGSAGMGVANALLEYLMVRCHMTLEEARQIFYITDNVGLLTKKRLGTDYFVLPSQEKFMRDEVDHEGLSILESVKLFKPSILIGLSGVGGLFTSEICAAMASYNERPVIFPMSNPSDHAECSAETAFKATNGTAIFASGSPFDDVHLLNGKVCKSNQGNNMFIFPGLGLACVVGKCKIVTNTMILTAAETLASTMSSSELELGIIYPDVSNIRQVSIICGVISCDVR